MKMRFIFLGLSIFVIIQITNSQTIDSTLKKITIRSKVFNEDRVVYVELPNNYKKSKTKFPVLYLLDGLANHRSVSTSVKLLSDEGFIPQMIIVCIENTNRNRDMAPTHSMKNYFGDDRDYNKLSGHADNFLRFLNTELIKNIDSTYQTNRYRIISGHSMTALLTLYALLDTSEIFSAFISVDPSLWWDNGSINDLTKQFIANKRFHSEKRLFLGTTASGQIQNKQLERYLGLININKIDNFYFNQYVYKSENHMTIPLKCNYDALQFIYKDLHISFDIIKNGRSEVEQFVRTVKEKYDYDIDLDETYLTNQGFDYIDNEQLDKAIQTLNLSLEYFPKSVKSNYLLGEAHRYKGINDKALIFYKKTLELDSTHRNAINGIKNIEKK
jgi:predicted alpha/beta superfamily hydrolase